MLVDMFTIHLCSPLYPLTLPSPIVSCYRNENLFVHQCLLNFASSHITGDMVLLDNVHITTAYVQINIRRCHSDGCDVRIHGIKALGSRQVFNSKGVVILLYLIKVISFVRCEMLQLYKHNSVKRGYAYISLREYLSVGLDTSFCINSLLLLL